MTTVLADRMINCIQTANAFKIKAGQWPSNQELYDIMSKTDSVYLKLRVDDDRDKGKGKGKGGTKTHTMWNHYCTFALFPQEVCGSGTASPRFAELQVDE